MNTKLVNIKGGDVICGLFYIYFILENGHMKVITQPHPLNSNAKLNGGY